MKLTVKGRELPEYEIADSCWTVFLNGEPVKGAWAFDTDAGVVHRYKPGDFHGYVLNENGDDIVSETLHGKVTIAPKVAEGVFNAGPMPVETL